MCPRALISPVFFHSAQISSSLSVCTPGNVEKHYKRSDSRTRVARAGLSTQVLRLFRGSCLLCSPEAVSLSGTYIMSGYLV